MYVYSFFTVIDIYIYIYKIAKYYAIKYIFYIFYSVKHLRYNIYH